jgi:hypothetical protein
MARWYSFALSGFGAVFEEGGVTVFSEGGVLVSFTICRTILTGC